MARAGASLVIGNRNAKLCEEVVRAIEQVLRDGPRTPDLGGTAHNPGDSITAVLIAAGTAATKWPLLINHDGPWPLFEGVETCMLLALSLLSLLGLRYPIKMLPILLFEIRSARLGAHNGTGTISGAVTLASGNPAAAATDDLLVAYPNQNPDIKVTGPGGDSIQISRNDTGITVTIALPLLSSSAAFDSHAVP